MAAEVFDQSLSGSPRQVATFAARQCDYPGLLAKIKHDYVYADDHSYQIVTVSRKVSDINRCRWRRWHRATVKRSSSSYELVNRDDQANQHRREGELYGTEICRGRGSIDG